MPLSAGDKLGPYEILAPIGAGGMGEVYRAHDPRLKRDVAIKVSQERFSDRFEREARAVAALNHPNICQIYDVGPNYLVMELIGGDTLAAQIERGPLTAGEALGLAAKIAEALEAAHEKGIVHRDLKPANIKVTPEGQVKVLDFGLAKSPESSTAGSGDGQNSPTITMSPTTAGMILGTAAYMSPEQARGKSVDKRTDIWAFGVVLYEMVTARRPFHGEDITEVVASVVKDKPDLAAVPDHLRPLLEACLEKDPKKRLRDIGDLKLLLHAPQETPGATKPAARLVWLWPGVAAVLALALAAVTAIHFRPAPLRPLERFDLPFDVVERLFGAFAISADGSRVAYLAKGTDGKNRLHVRLLDQPSATPVAGTEDAQSPFFSPDGQWLGFASGGSLKKVLVQGGAPVKLCPADSMRGGSWGDDGFIIFTPNNRAPLYRVPDSGGTPEQITTLASGEVTHRYPQVLPGSRLILFSSNTTPAPFEGSTLQVLSMQSRQSRTIYRGGFYGRFASGHLLWAHEGMLFAAEADLERAVLKSSPVPVLQDLASDAGSGIGNFEVSPFGILVAVTGYSANIDTQPVILDSNGKAQTLPAPRGRYNSLSFSPDGKLIATDNFGINGKGDIYIYDVDRQRLFPLTFTGYGRAPLWTPDGKHIVFMDGAASQPARILWVRADGSGQPERLLESRDNLILEGVDSFSPDGRQLIFTTLNGKSLMLTLPLDLSDPDHPKPGAPRPLIAGGSDRDGIVSPDGRWLAYVHVDPGAAAEIYVQPFPGTGGKWKISSGGGIMPRWAGAQRLFFVSPSDRRIMVLDYQVEGNSFVAGKPRAWSGLPISLFSGYDVTPDGKRAVAALVPEGANTAAHLTFLLNFFDELRRSAPASK